MNSLGIRQKAIALFFACALLPLVVVAIGAYGAARRALEGFIVADLSVSGHDAARHLERFLAEAQTDLKTWSTLGVMQDALIADEDRAIQTELKRLRQRYPHFAELVVLDPAGQAIAATSAKNFGKRAAAAGLLDAIARHGAYQGEVERSELTGATALLVASPILANYDRTRVIGILVGAIDWRSVQAMLAEVSIAGAKQDASRFLLLVRRADGALLYRTAAAAELASIQSLVVERRDTLAEDVVVNAGSHLVSSARARALGELTDTGWNLHTVVATDVAFASVNQLRGQFAFVGVMMCIGVLCIGWFGASTLVRPITALIGAMKQVAAGDTTAEIPALERRDELGAMAQALRVFQDNAVRIQDEVRLRAALAEEKNANRAKSEFLAMVGHELRTPLNAIIGFSEIIKDQTFGADAGARYRDYANDINHSGQHLLELINDILDLTKFEAGKFELHEEDVDVYVAVQSVEVLLKERAARQEIKFAAELPAGLPRLWADKTKLKQVLVNLASNAIKFTHPGGRVRIAAKFDAAEGFVFAVEDTGIGIAAEDIPKAMAVFGQVDSALARKYEGTGLGLPLSKAMVELHGGVLELTSQVGVGTKVTVRLPASRAIPMRRQMAPADPGVMVPV
jgi:signal transduction histidine kinase